MSLFRYELGGKFWSAKALRRVDDILVFIQDATSTLEAERAMRSFGAKDTEEVVRKHPRSETMVLLVVFCVSLCSRSAADPLRKKGS